MSDPTGYWITVHPWLASGGIPEGIPKWERDIHQFATEIEALRYAVKRGHEVRFVPFEGEMVT